MFLTDAGEEQLFESLVEISVIVAYPHNTILDDVSHNLFFFSSTFYPYSRQKTEMLHDGRRFFVLFVIILKNLTIFAAE